MSENEILYAEKGRCRIIKMIGELRHTASPGLDAAINGVFARGQVGEFIIDLSDTVYIDSTNLGLLAKIARRAAERGMARPVIVSDHEDVNVVLQSMGFDQAFTISDRPPVIDVDLVAAPPVDADRDDRAQLILDAHMTLAEMNGKSRHVFRDVVDMFQKDIAQEKQPS